MRQVLAVIAAILAATAAMITQWVFRAGRWVMETITPAATPAAMPAVTSPASASDADDTGAIRRVAGVLAQGRVPTPGELKGIGDRQLQWLEALDRRQLCTLLTKDPPAIRAHVLGRTMIQGVPGADADSIRQLRAAKEASLQRTMAAASAARRRDEVERQILEMETGNAIPAM